MQSSTVIIAVIFIVVIIPFSEQRSIHLPCAGIEGCGRHTRSAAEASKELSIAVPQGSFNSGVASGAGGTAVVDKVIINSYDVQTNISVGKPSPNQSNTYVSKPAGKKGPKKNNGQVKPSAE